MPINMLPTKVEAGRKLSNWKSCRSILHLRTQNGQPYGSVRRCCERCGTMIWLGTEATWTDETLVYENPPDDFTPCNRRPPCSKEAT